MAKKIAAGALFFLVTTSIFAIAIAKTECSKSNSSSHYGYNSSSWSSSSCSSGNKNDTQQVSKTIYVDWETGFDSQDWAARNVQIYVNDTLVFKYPTDGKYTVYSMPNMDSYFNCKFNSSAKLIANTTAGAGDGFLFVLEAKGHWSDPKYYFASLNHCEPGGQGMKLSVYPMHRY